MLLGSLGRLNSLGNATVIGLIQSAAARYGVPPAIALAVAQRESGYNQSARGAAGEIGVFQLMPKTAGDLGVNPYDLSQNIEGGVRYLAQQYQRFGNWEQALQAYNGGAAHVVRGDVSMGARGYAAGVLSVAQISPTLVTGVTTLPAPAPSGPGPVPEGMMEVNPWILGAIGGGLLLFLVTRS